MKRYLFIFFFGVSVFGCGIKTEDKNLPELTSHQAQTEKVQFLAKLGESCAGVNNVLCSPGNTCNYSRKHADRRGICIKDIVDENLDCSEVKEDIVCAEKNNEKTAYGNECQAKRRKAKILKKGLCSVDVTVKNNCKAKAKAINSSVFKTHEGFQFDGTICEKVYIHSELAEIPFERKSDCEKTCL